MQLFDPLIIIFAPLVVIFAPSVVIFTFLEESNKTQNTH